MRPTFTQTSHRPWPHPPLPYHWRQSWMDLAFAHWRIEADHVRPLLPPSLHLDTFDGSAWIGIVPFRMENVMRRGLPNLPGISAFPELNLRTYVHYKGKPGVWFFSLDASNSLAVWAARRFFHLPYENADIEFTQTDDSYSFRSYRPNHPLAATFKARYRPTAPVALARPGTLEHWLTERYCLYAQSPNHTLYCAEVHHDPWPLQTAEMEIQQNDLLAPHGISVSGPPETVHFAKALHVAVWNGKPVAP